LLLLPAPGRRLARAEGGRRAERRGVDGYFDAARPSMRAFSRPLDVGALLRFRD
jgi:hypothetical protein